MRAAERIFSVLDGLKPDQTRTERVNRSEMTTSSSTSVKPDRRRMAALPQRKRLSTFSTGRQSITKLYGSHLAFAQLANECSHTASRRGGFRPGGGNGTG